MLHNLSHTVVDGNVHMLHLRAKVFVHMISFKNQVKFWYRPKSFNEFSFINNMNIFPEGCPPHFRLAQDECLFLEF